MNWSSLWGNGLQQLHESGRIHHASVRKCHSSRGGGIAVGCLRSSWGAEAELWVCVSVEARLGCLVLAQSWRRQGCTCGISAAVAPLSRHSELSPAHVIVVSHFLIKMYQFIAWYFSWMHGGLCVITTRTSLHCRYGERWIHLHILHWVAGEWKSLRNEEKITHPDLLSILSTAVMAWNL